MIGATSSLNVTRPGASVDGNAGNALTSSAIRRNSRMDLRVRI
jgi:hypothetical protein